MQFILELIGTITFAFSGAYVAIDYSLDWLGIIVLAVTTACGGGMTRDVLLGNTPPMLFRNPTNVYIAVIVAFITMMLYKPITHSKLKDKILGLINIFDAMGLAIFTIVGMQIAIDLGFETNTFLVCFMGVLSAVGGGLLRDIMANRTPIVLSKEIYATASFFGSIFFYFTKDINYNVSTIVSIVLIFAIRVWAIKKNKNLPYVSKN